jgi:hypothetical protein
MRPRIFYKNMGSNQAILDLRVEDGEIFLSAVDSDGEIIADLIVFEDDRCRACANAKANLEAFGFDTSFTKWNGNGSMIVE